MMKTKLLQQSDRQRIFAPVFDSGDEVISGTLEFTARQKLTSTQITGIGALSAVVLL